MELILEGLESGQMPESWILDPSAPPLEPLSVDALDGSNIPPIMINPVRAFPVAPRSSPLPPVRKRQQPPPKATFFMTTFSAKRAESGYVEAAAEPKQQLVEARPKRVRVNKDRFYDSITGKQLINPVSTNCNHYFNQSQVEEGKPCPKCKTRITTVKIDQQDQILMSLLHAMKHDL